MATSVSSVTSHFPDAENGFSTTTSGSVASGATTVGLNSVAGYTNGEPVVFVIDPANSKKQTFTGIMDTAGSQITGVIWTAGTNVAHDAGATVVDYATATHIAMMSKGIKVQHAQDGTHTAVTATSVSTDTISEKTVNAGVTVDGMLIKDSKLATDSSVVTANITDESVTSRKLAPTVISETATANVTGISSEVDITGCTTTFTPAIASIAIVWGVFHFLSGSTANDIFYGALNVDSSNEAEVARYHVPTSGGGGTFAQVWVVPLTAASHTLKLRAGRVSGSGTASVGTDHTKLLVWLIGNDNVTDS